MAEVNCKCKCGKNEGWLVIRDEDYKIDCVYCGRIYIIKSNGEIEEHTPND